MQQTQSIENTAVYSTFEKQASPSHRPSQHLAGIRPKGENWKKAKHSNNNGYQLKTQEPKLHWV